jgi:hypothetical protein
VFDERLALGQRVESLLKDQAARLHDAAQFQNRIGHRIDMVIQHPMNRILDAIDHIIQV